MKKGVSFLLALSLLLGLTACGQKEETGQDLHGDGSVYYIPAFQKLNIEEMSAFLDACVLGDYAYLVGSVETEVSNSENRLFRVSLKNGKVEELPGCERAEQEDPNVIASSQYAAWLCAGPGDTLWLMERVARWYYDFPEGADPGPGARSSYYQGSDAHYILHQLDPQGQELSRKEWAVEELEKLLGLKEGSYAYIKEMRMDGDGDLFFRTIIGGDTGILTAMSPQGSLLCQVELEGDDWEWGDLVLLSDGRMGIARGDKGVDGYAALLNTVDKIAGRWDESFRLPSGYDRIVYDGCGDALFYYVVGKDLMAWQETEGEAESTRVLNWISTGIKVSYSMSLASFLPDGRMVLMENGYLGETGGQLELVVLTPTEGPLEKVVLTFGTVGLSSELEAVIREFNRTNADYLVEVRDYMDYSQDSDWASAMTRMATEVAAGKMPDIMNVGNMPVARWAASGLLEDLWPWIDRDPKIRRKDLMERVFEAASIDGRLYEISNSFSIQTVVGARDTVGERLSWTTQDMWAALETMPEGCIVIDDNQSSMLTSMLNLDWERFVDWERGTCSFDGGEFRSLLEYCGRFPENWPNPATRVRRLLDRQQMLQKTDVGSYEDLQEYKAFFGGEVSFAGYPNDWGETGSRFRLGESCAMTSACRDKKGAWTFLRTLLLPRDRENDFETAFSTNREDFQRLAKEAMESRKDGVTADFFGEIRITYRSATQEECDQIMELYDTAEGIYRRDMALEEIITEAAGAYFAGDKTLDETAALIQNRAQLYVSERN